MSDSPSPLALAREAAETAREEFWATRLRQAQVGSAVYPPAHNRLQQAREKMDRAIRAEREALVEATLRWAKGVFGAKIGIEPGHVHGYSSRGWVEIPLAAVLTAIEKEANRV